MLKRWQIAALLIGGLAAIVFAGSFGFPAESYVCRPDDYNHTKECTYDHLGPAVVLTIVTWLDIHGGLITAVATAAIAWFTIVLARGGERQTEHFKVTERAYVRMSHISEGRDGLEWDKEVDSGEFDVLIDIKNCGRTPGRVTAVWLTKKVVPKGQEFPDDFSYGDGALSYDSGEGYTFLMPSDSFSLLHKGQIPEADRAAVDSKNGILIVYGYVDYIDQFGEHHRAGYGRQYVPRQGGNNLGFPRVRAKLNYDDVRSEGPG